MNTIVFNKLTKPVIFEDNANEVERSSINYIEVIEGQHPDILSSAPAIKDNHVIRHRRSGYVSQFLFKLRDKPYKITDVINEMCLIHQKTRGLIRNGRDW